MVVLSFESLSEPKKEFAADETLLKMDDRPDSDFSSFFLDFEEVPATLSERPLAAGGVDALAGLVVVVAALEGS